MWSLLYIRYETPNGIYDQTTDGWSLTLNCSDLCEETGAAVTVYTDK
jgi:hypothetical protein